MTAPATEKGATMTNEELNEYQIELRELYRFRLEYYKAAAGHSHTYTAVIVFGSYGALLTVWWGLHDIIAPAFTAAAGGLAILSVVIFISHELWSVYQTGKWQIGLARALSKQTLEENAAEFVARDRDLIAFNEKYGPLWMKIFLTSVFSGTGAAVVLMIGIWSSYGFAFWSLAWWKTILGL